MAWNQQKNDIFFQRVGNLADAMQSVSEEIARLADIWQAEGLADGDPAFVDARGMTVADIAAMVGIAGAYQAFLDNGVVAQADRRPDLARILASRRG